MGLMGLILSESNLKCAIRSVKKNKGAPGIDKMTVGELDEYFRLHGNEIRKQIFAKHVFDKKLLLENIYKKS